MLSHWPVSQDTIGLWFLPSDLYRFGLDHDGRVEVESKAMETGWNWNYTAKPHLLSTMTIIHCEVF